MKKLNWGCGSIQPRNWDNVDNDFNFVPQNEIEPDNFFSNTSQMADDTYDIIVAHCSLQMVEWHQIVDQLKELRRILKPGGILRISLPDIEKGFQALKDDFLLWFPNQEMQIHERFSAWLTWYSTSKSLMTPKALEIKLRAAGFEDIRQTVCNRSRFEVIEATELDTRNGECYFTEAQKQNTEL